MSRGSVLSNVVLVLDHPQDIVNIAAIVRVMMNFGISRLRLVNPCELDTYRIEGIAHRSTPIVEAATLHETLQDALKDCIHVVGTTARARTASRTYVRPREAGAELVARAREGMAAILFGREDKGLFNEALDLCHAVAIIPTDPGYPSLNLAQASLVMVYETFLAAEAAPAELPRGRRATRMPTQEELEVTYRGLEQGLAAVDFFKGKRPETIMRTLRTLVGRARPDLREAKLLAAMGFEVAHYVERLKRRLADAERLPEVR